MIFVIIPVAAARHVAAFYPVAQDVPVIHSVAGAGKYANNSLLTDIQVRLLLCLIRMISFKSKPH